MVSCARRSIDGAPAAVGSVLDIYLLSVCLSVSLAAAALTSTELSLCLSHSLRLPRLSHSLSRTQPRRRTIEEPSMTVVGQPGHSVPNQNVNSFISYVLQQFRGKLTVHAKGEV